MPTGKNLQGNQFKYGGGDRSHMLMNLDSNKGQIRTISHGELSEGNESDTNMN